MPTTSSPFLKFNKMRKQIGLDGFILMLIAMIVMAKFWPQIGAKDSVLPLSHIANVGVSFIFFFYGLRLSPKKLLQGISNWRLHLLIHVTTFLLFPLIVLAVRLIAGNRIDETIMLGVFFVACLPSTVSSAVVMVSIAKGNIPAAIFNASLSMLIGVSITPLWMGIYMGVSSGSVDLVPIIIKLLLQVLLPVVIGIMLNSRWGNFAEKHRNKLRYFDQGIILLIVYTAFCESFSEKVFDDYSLEFLLILGAGMVAMFYTVYAIVYVISRLLHFNREDKITAQFCGSKKSLVHGTVMSKVLFPHNSQLGIILLPIMMYHALQLITVSIIAQWFRRKSDDGRPKTEQKNQHN
jgi:solute carrier family 10 (sodium/bile acid cotransporter), member 7